MGLLKITSLLPQLILFVRGRLALGFLCKTRLTGRIITVPQSLGGSLGLGVVLGVGGGVLVVGVGVALVAGVVGGGLAGGVGRLSLQRGPGGRIVS